MRRRATLPGLLSLLLSWAVVACGAPVPPEPAPCAWFGSVRGEILYFGRSTFWPRWRADRAAPRSPGTGAIGRFDLTRRRAIRDLPAPGAGGVWDVHAAEDGRVYFARFYGSPGWIDVASGRSEVWHHLGPGTAELVPAGEDLLFAQYAEGAVLRVARDGKLRARLPLPADGPLRVAPKSVAFDPRRGEIWVVADRLTSSGEVAGRDAWVLDEAGTPLRHLATREVQFASFSRDRGEVAEIRGDALWLRRSRGETTEEILLDPDFPRGLDFVQDIQRDPRDPGRVVLTRWSGALHVVDSRGSARRLQLPRRSGELYYSGFLSGGFACATRCGAPPDVVCRSLAP